MARAVPLFDGGENMFTVVIHPEVQVREKQQFPAYCTCRKCRHTFHPKNEDQSCLELCDHCLDEQQMLHEPVISVHVKPQPRRAAK